MSLSSPRLRWTHDRRPHGAARAAGAASHQCRNSDFAGACQLFRGPDGYCWGLGSEREGDSLKVRGVRRVRPGGRNGHPTLTCNAAAEADDFELKVRFSTSSRSTRRPRWGKRSATADQHRVDPGPVLVDQIQRGRLGGESRAADRDVALSWLRSQPLDFLGEAAGGQAGIALHLQ